MDSALSPIIIRLEGMEEGGHETVASPSGGGTEPKPDAEIAGGKIDGAVKKLISPVAAVHMAQRLAQNEISVVELRTGAREYEQKLQFGKQVADSAISMGMSVIAGLVTGNPLIAVVGIATTAVSKAIDIAQQYRVLDIKKSREDISLGLARLRAGGVNPVASGGRGE